jgi:hypothetical protein
MILAGLFATVLFLGLIVGDWLYFIRLTPDAVRYGCRVADRPDQWSGAAISAVRQRFTPNGVLMLPNGVTWFYPELSQIAIPRTRMRTWAARVNAGFHVAVRFSSRRRMGRGCGSAGIG